MPSADYYRRQADVCVRLSVAHSDEAISRRLIILARAYIAVADDISGHTQARESDLPRSAELTSHPRYLPPSIY
jgi:hypothetical protein